MARKKRKPSKLSRLASMIGRDILAARGSLLAFELLYKLVAAGLLSSAAGALVALLVASSGSAAINNDAIATFAATPRGLLTGLVAATLAFAIAFTEQAGLLVIAGRQAKGQPAGAIEAALIAGRRAATLVQLALLQLAGYAAIALPIAGAAFGVYRWLLGAHDINFYLAVRPPEFYAAVAIGVALALTATAALLALHMRWLLAIPAVVLDGQGARAALAGSWKLSRGSLTTIAAAVGGWAVGTALLGALAALALELISRFAIGLAGERLALLAPTVALVLIANAVVATAVSIVAGASHAMLVGRLYQGARMGAGLPLAAALPSPVAAAAGPVWFARRWVWIAACCALFAATALGGVALVESLGVADDVAVTAHRGSSRRAPENSLAAIRLAIEDGADFAEIDVQETADGQIVVLHDADLMRVAGLNRNIWDVTVAELADLDAGSWFDPKFADERIPTLAQAVAAARGKIKLNIELKYNGHDERLAERVVEVLNEHDFVDQCVITSLHLDGALAAKKLEPRLQVGAITAVSIGRAAGLDVDFLSVADHQATRAFIAAAHGGGKTVHVWTVNDEASMNRMIDRGADNLITDEPALARRLLDERSRLSNSQRLLLKLRTWLEG